MKLYILSNLKALPSTALQGARPESHSGTYECVMKTAGGEARCEIRCRVVPKEKKNGKKETEEVDAKTATAAEA